MRRASSGQFVVELPAAQAIGLFTPEGERAWVPDWNPAYASGEPCEAPGTVFTTDTGGVYTIWVIIEIDRVANAAAYARVTPGRHAGTVRVRCVDGAQGTSIVTVDYDMSPLDGGDPADLHVYGTVGFNNMMDEWARAVAAHLETRPS